MALVERQRFDPTYLTGVILSLVGGALVLVCLCVFAHERLESVAPVVMYGVIAALSLVFAGLTFYRPNSSSWLYIFGSLALVIPTIIVLFVGGWMMISAVMFGMNSVMLTVFLLFLSALLAFAGSVTLLVHASAIARRA